MATAITLSPKLHGVYENADIKNFSANVANELLDKNHNSFNIFFNPQGFHNHQVDYLLTAFALGASPEKLQEAFDTNYDYQRPLPPLNEDNVSKMEDVDFLMSLFGKREYFRDIRTFFERKMQVKGWQNVVNEYLFSKTPVAEDLMVRMFSSIIHPIIHFGLGVEFQQPAIVAEALAEAAVHLNEFPRYLLESEKRSQAAGDKPGRNLAQLIHEIEQDPVLGDPSHWGDGANIVDDDTVSRAPDKLIRLASEWRVSSNELARKTAEMMNVNAWVTGGAQRPPKEVKFDFFFIHHMNCAIFQSAFNQQNWMSEETKCRLLEWKGRMDLINYASRLAPKLLIDEIVNYEPRQNGMTWASIIERVHKIPDDDGHVQKLVRALAHAEKVSAPFEKSDSDAFPIQGQMWLQLGNMAIDSTSGAQQLSINSDGNVSGFRWVRGAGSADAWDNVEYRAARL